MVSVAAGAIATAQAWAVGDIGNTDAGNLGRHPPAL